MNTDPQTTFRLMIVAGEASGDAHAAKLVQALQEITAKRVDCFGGTGPKMRAAGVSSIVDTDQLSIVGLLEIGRALPKFIRAYKQLKSAALERQAEAVVLVDWPDFNLPLARALHRRGIKVIYYISPQLWAWRPRRVERIRHDIDLLLTILPFERDWYRARGVDHVEFVGHPLAGEVHSRYDRDEFARINHLDPARPIISLLPGSRHKEVQRILPPMLDAARLLSQSRPDVQIVVVVAPSRSAQDVEQIVQSKVSELRVAIVENQTREALAASDAAAVASGTATLEAGLLHTPMVVVYKESAINWHTLGRLITAQHFGLVNLIAEDRVATELMQDEFTAQTLAEELSKLLEPKTNAAVRTRLTEVTSKLGEGGASMRGAETILRFLNWV